MKTNFFFLNILGFLFALLGSVSAQEPLHIFKGHKGAVLSVAFSPDGKTFCSGDGTGFLKLWDFENRTEIKTFMGHNGQITDVVFSPDGQLIVSSGQDSTLIVWDIKTGEQKTTLRGHKNRVTCIAFSPNGQFIVSGSEDNTLKIWNVGMGKEIRTILGSNDGVYSVAFSPDGKTILSGGGDNHVKLWDFQKGTLIRTMKGHTFPATTVAFSPDGKKALSGAYFYCEKDIILWNLQTGAGTSMKETQEEFSHNIMSYSARHLAFSPDGKLVAMVSSYSGYCYIYDMTMKTVVITFNTNNDYFETNELSFSPDGKYILSAHGQSMGVMVDNPFVILWEVKAEVWADTKRKEIEKQKEVEKARIAELKLQEEQKRKAQEERLAEEKRLKDEQQRKAEEIRIAKQKEAAKQALLQANANKINWKMGNKLCKQLSSGGIVVASLNAWNEDKSMAQVKVITSPGGTLEGESLSKGNTFWVHASGAGWHLCLDEEVQQSLSNDGSNTQSKPQVPESEKYRYAMGDAVRCYRWENNSGWQGLVVGKADGKYQVKITRVNVNGGFLATQLNASTCTGNEALMYNDDGKLIWVPKNCVE